MEAVLKNGTVEQIDTTYLFNDQYNTVSGKRIFDGEILEIRGDVRYGLGKCRYCGKMVRRGEEEEHYRQKESEKNPEGCRKCFWFSKGLVCGNSEVVSKSETRDDQNHIVVETVEKHTKVYEEHCRYEDTDSAKAPCCKMECRIYGIEWFTPENTFFLRNPKGFSILPVTAADLDKAGFIPKGTLQVSPPKDGVWAWDRKYKIGSYELQAFVLYENGAMIGVQYFMLWNMRHSYRFRYENGEWYTHDYTFGWRHEESLKYIPSQVVERVVKIISKFQMKE